MNKILRKGHFGFIAPLYKMEVPSDTPINHPLEVYKVLDRYLRMYTNDNQDKWTRLLHLEEYGCPAAKDTLQEMQDIIKSLKDNLCTSEIEPTECERFFEEGKASHFDWRHSKHAQLWSCISYIEPRHVFLYFLTVHPLLITF